MALWGNGTVVLAPLIAPADDLLRRIIDLKEYAARRPDPGAKLLLEIAILECVSLHKQIAIVISERISIGSTSPDFGLHGPFKVFVPRGVRRQKASRAREHAYGGTRGHQTAETLVGHAI